MSEKKGNVDLKYDKWIISTTERVYNSPCSVNYPASTSSTDSNDIIYIASINHYAIYGDASTDVSNSEHS